MRFERSENAEFIINKFFGIFTKCLDNVEMPATTKHVRIIKMYRSRFQFRWFQSIVAPSHERIVSERRSPLASELNLQDC